VLTHYSSQWCLVVLCKSVWTGLKAGKGFSKNLKFSTVRRLTTMVCPYSKFILESTMLAVSVGPQRFTLLLELTYIQPQHIYCNKVIYSLYYSGAQIFQNSWIHIQILGARMVTWNSSILSFHNSGVSSESYCYLSLSAWCMRTDTRVFLKEKIAVISLKILDITVQNIVIQVTRSLEFCLPLLYWIMHIRILALNTAFL